MGSERSKSALNCHGQPNHFPPMISNSSNIWTVRERSGADNGWAACCITTIALRPEPQAPKGAFHVCSHGGLGISTYQSLDRGDEIDGCRSSEQRIRFGGAQGRKGRQCDSKTRRPAIEFLDGTRKRRIQPRKFLRIYAPALDPTRNYRPRQLWVGMSFFFSPRMEVRFHVSKSRDNDDQER